MILDSDSDSPLGPFSVYDLFPCSSPGRRPLQALTLSNITFLREDLSPAGLDNLVDVATAPTPQNSAIVLRWRAHLSTLVTVDGAGTYQFVPTLSSSASELVVAHCRARGIRPQHNHRLTLSIQGLSRYYAWPGPDSRMQDRFILYSEDGKGGSPFEFTVKTIELSSLQHSLHALRAFSVLCWMRQVKRVSPMEEGVPRGLEYYVNEYKKLYPYQREADQRKPTDDQLGIKTTSRDLRLALASAGSMRSFRARAKAEGLLTRKELNELILDIHHLRKNGYLQRASPPPPPPPPQVEKGPPIQLEDETRQRNLSHSESGYPIPISRINDDKLLSIPLVFFDIPDIAYVEGAEFEWKCPGPMEPCAFKIRLPAKTPGVVGPSDDVRLLQFREQVSDHMWQHIEQLGIDFNPFVEENTAMSAAGFLFDGEEWRRA